MGMETPPPPVFFYPRTFSIYIYFKTSRVCMKKAAKKLSIHSHFRIGTKIPCFSASVPTIPYRTSFKPAFACPVPQGNVSGFKSIEANPVFRFSSFLTSSEPMTADTSLSEGSVILANITKYAS